MHLLFSLSSLVLFVTCHDDLYILIDEVSVYNCKGIRNEIKITEDDIDIVNERGNKVHYIRAPGNYTLDFRKISVKENFGYLAGEIGITLQVPILEGPAGIRFDLPYTMVPETTLLSQKCDAHSGIVERDGKQFCRYCDLCGVSGAIESQLKTGGHQFLPAVGSPDEQPFGPACGSIQRNSYQFKRTISLPSKSALENMMKDKVQGVDGEIKKRLNKGRGRFQVFLNLITADKPSISQARWFAQKSECKCCVTPNDRSCSSLSFLYCNLEECKSEWAQMCLHNTARIAACYTVEFNYRMTTSYADVQLFLEEKGVREEMEPLSRRIVNPPPKTQHRFPAVGPSSLSSSASSSQQRFGSHSLEAAQLLAQQREQQKREQELRERYLLQAGNAPRIEHPQSAEQPQRQFFQPVFSTSSPPPVTTRTTPSPAIQGTQSERCVAIMPARLQHLRRYCTIFWNAKLCCSHCEGVC